MIMVGVHIKVILHLLNNLSISDHWRLMFAYTIHVFGPIKKLV